MLRSGGEGFRRAGARPQKGSTPREGLGKGELIYIIVYYIYIYIYTYVLLYYTILYYSILYYTILSILYYTILSAEESAGPPPPGWQESGGSSGGSPHEIEQLRDALNLELRETPWRAQSIIIIIIIIVIIYIVIIYTNTYQLLLSLLLLLLSLPLPLSLLLLLLLSLLLYSLLLSSSSSLLFFIFFFFFLLLLSPLRAPFGPADPQRTPGPSEPRALFWAGENRRDRNSASPGNPCERCGPPEPGTPGKEQLRKSNLILGMNMIVSNS